MIVEWTQCAVTMASAPLQGVKYTELARRNIKYGKLRCWRCQVSCHFVDSLPVENFLYQYKMCSQLNTAFSIWTHLLSYLELKWVDGHTGEGTHSTLMMFTLTAVWLYSIADYPWMPDTAMSDKNGWFDKNWWIIENFYHVTRMQQRFSQFISILYAGVNYFIKQNKFLAASKMVVLK